jgi:hypothetical protein
MSIITDALKLAAAQEKLISKQENEIANLKVKLEAAINGKAAADEATRIARESLKAVNATAGLEVKEVKRVAKAELAVVQAELKQAKADLKVALKTPKAPKVVPTNDALGEVKRKPGRPKKVVEATPEVPAEPAAPEVDPRQMNLPEIGEPVDLSKEMQTLATLNEEGKSSKGFHYEFV